MTKKRKRPLPRQASSGGSGNGSSGGGANASSSILAVPKGLGVNVLPSLLRSLAAGFGSVLRAPALVFFPLLLVGVIWAALLFAGLRYLPPVMVDILSIPPAGSLFDVSIGAAVIGYSGSMLFMLVVFTAIRAVITSVMVGMLDEAATHGSVSMVGVLRGLQAFGAIMVFEYLALTVALLSTILLPAFSSLGNIMNIVIPIGAMFMMSMAPFVAVRQRDGVGPAQRRISGGESIRRAAKAARLPGWPRFLTLIVLYYFIMAIGIPIFQPGRDQVTVAPSLQSWLWVFGAAVLNVGFFATIGVFWRAAEPYVGGQTRPQPRTRAPRARR